MKQTKPTYHDLLQKNQQLVQENQYLKEKLRIAALKEDSEPVENSCSRLFSNNEQETAKRYNELQKSLILDAVTESVSYYDTELNIIWTNKAAAHMVGKSPHELTGRRCYEVWHNKNKPCTNCPVLKAKKLKLPQNAEQQTPDGKYWKIRSYPVFDRDHRVVALAEFGYDITEQKQMERELKESEERFRKSFDTGIIAMAISRKSDGTYLEANPGFLKITGYTKDEIIGHHSRDLGFFSGPQRKKLIADLKQHGKLHNQELRFPAKSGKYKIILFSIVPIHVNGESCLLATMVDITERKKQENMTRESEFRYRKLMEKAPVGIALFLNNKLYAANNKYLEILGYSNMDELKKNASAEKPDLKSDNSDTFRHYEKNGVKKHIAESTSEFNINGKRYVQVIIQDITEVISLEEKRKKLAGEIAYVERNLQILQKVELELFKIINTNHYKKEHFTRITKMIQNEVHLDRHWQIFRNNFESIHLGFFNKLNAVSAKLTQQDIKHCALIKMNFETKEIAALFHIQPTSVQISRVRLKKKLGLKPHQDLIHYIMTL
jgi:PAS domain S-box-containing protein